MYDDNDASPTPVRRPMVRSNSDPSIATLENIPGIPPYQAPPSYMREGKHVSIGVMSKGVNETVISGFIKSE